MSWFYQEDRIVSRTRLIADLVHHLQRRCVSGASVIIVDKPTLQLAVIRKEWLRAEYQVERQAASTLGLRRMALIHEHNRLQTIHFKSKANNTSVEVMLAAPDEASNTLPSGFATLYVLAQITDGQRTSFASRLRRGGLIVDYRILK